MSRNSKTHQIFAASTAAVLFLTVLTGSILVLRGAATAETAPLPPPTAPSLNWNADCEWMGELVARNTVNARQVSGQGTAQSIDTFAETTDIKMVTAQIDGITCGMKWSAEHNYRQDSVMLLSYCALGAAGQVTRTSTIQSNETGSGVYSSSLQNFGGGNAVSFFGQSPVIGMTMNISWSNPICGPSLMESTLRAHVIGNSNCIFSPAGQTIEGLEIAPTAQATKGSCVARQSQHTGDVDIEGTTTISWRLRKVICDTAIDSDRGGVSDCQEYADGTNPTIGSDDRAALSPEAQTIVNIAKTTGNECFGKINSLAAKQAKDKNIKGGVPGVFASWNLKGIPGISASSSAQQKIDAVKAYCAAV